MKRRLALLWAPLAPVFDAAACGGEPEEQAREKTTQEEQVKRRRKRQQASYYGEEFAGAPAVAGEPYDRFTAAHSYCRSVPSLR